jgi:Uma2 family endonuclease
MAATARLTAEELLRLNLPNKRTELVRGQLFVREPAGYEHGRVAAKLLVKLANYVEANGLGAVFAAETGFKLASDPDTVRAPDAAFIQQARLPEGRPVGYVAIAPDLVVEVRSPGDTASKVREKVDAWLEAGCALVWVVDSTKRRAQIHRANGTESTVSASDELDGESTVIGFRCRLDEVIE